MTLTGRLLRAFDRVDDALACYAELYDITLDLRELADKNSEAEKLLRRLSDRVDTISRELLVGAETLGRLEHMVEAELDAEEDGDESTVSGGSSSQAALP